jgi:hypothetical protein
MTKAPNHLERALLKHALAVYAADRAIDQARENREISLKDFHAAAKNFIRAERDENRYKQQIDITFALEGKMVHIIFHTQNDEVPDITVSPYLVAEPETPAGGTENAD